jgi:hypothetical protein
MTTLPVCKMVPVMDTNSNHREVNLRLSLDGCKYWNSNVSSIKVNPRLKIMVNGEFLGQ